MNRWVDLMSANPELASTGTRLLYQGSEIASAFLATVGPDSTPRVHPVFPVLALDSLWLFIVNISPKYRDLKSSGRFALHSFPIPGGGEEFHLRGVAVEHKDFSIKKAVSDSTDNRQGTLDFEALFECRIASALYTYWENWGTENAWPHYEKWFPEHDA